MKMKTPFGIVGTLAGSAAALSLVMVGCGGGDDPPPTPSALQVLAKDGDVFPGGFEVGTIESAEMAEDGTVAIIASERATPSFNGVFLRSPSGDLSEVLGADSPLAEGLSFGTVRNLSVAATGEFAFQVGDQLDQDGLFYWDGSSVSALARTAPGQTPDGFRVLGAVRTAGGGDAIFSAGVTPCEVDSTDPNDPEVKCDLNIYRGTGDTVSRIDVPNTLSAQRPNAVLIEVNSLNEAALGLPARGNEPLVGRVVNGEFEGLLSRRQDIEGLGILQSARPRAISDTGAIALDGFIDLDRDGERDEEHILLYDRGTLTTIARSGGTFEGNPEVDLRAEGIDGANRVVYRVEFESEAAGGEELVSLRAWENGSTRYIAHEGLRYGEDDKGNERRILDIEQVRVGANGDVLMVCRLGREDPETGDRRISGTALLRWNGSSLATVLELGALVNGKELVSQISIADVNANGDLLLISSLDRSAIRVLLFLPRSAGSVS